MTKAQTRGKSQKKKSQNKKSRRKKGRGGSKGSGRGRRKPTGLISSHVAKRIAKQIKQGPPSICPSCIVDLRKSNVQDSLWGLEQSLLKIDKRKPKNVSTVFPTPRKKKKHPVVNSEQEDNLGHLETSVRKNQQKILSESSNLFL